MLMKFDGGKFIDEVMVKAQLAACLEVSGYPKPGNVHRLRDFPDTRFEHFIAGSIAIGPAIRFSASSGIRAGLNEIDLNDISIGSLIKRAVLNVNCFHSGGNTHFGMITLFIPLAASAGMCFAKWRSLSEVKLRTSFIEIVKSTTIRDALDFCEALRIAGVGGLGKLSNSSLPDVNSSDVKNRIVSENITLYDLLDFSSSWDLVASEFVNGLETVFSVGYPSFLEFYEEYNDINIAIVHSFLKLLSIKPDTFIARKFGLKFSSDIVEALSIGLNFSRNISLRAQRILDLGGLTSSDGRRELFKLDDELANAGLNPGSTADVLATSLFAALLLGFKL